MEYARSPPRESDIEARRASAPHRGSNPPTALVAKPLDALAASYDLGIDDSSLTKLRDDGVMWCIMVQKSARLGKSRFTVTLDVESYTRLKALVENHDPPLTLNYGVQFAVKLLLDRAGDRQDRFDFADPTRWKGER